MGNVYLQLETNAAGEPTELLPFGSIDWYHWARDDPIGPGTAPMNSKQQKTREAIFAEPVRANVAWSDVESLLVGLGATLTEGRGSRVHAELNGEDATFHRPHPQRECSKPLIRSVRKFLVEAGEAPGED
jgi:hypothetical protein